ncbi:phosphatase [Phycicoccus ginsengisoli]
MRSISKAAAVGVAGTAVVGTVLALGSGSATASSSTWESGDVRSANPRVGVQGNVLASGLTAQPVAWGALGLANPDTAAGVTHYGYDTANGGPLTQDAKEAFKTEPDKNVYLTLAGHHYLYQGHEGGPQGYVTRIDLDEPDPAKRVLLMADTDTTGAPLPTFDGITWNPFTRQLMMTAEAKAPKGGVWALTLDATGKPTTGTAVRLPALGSGGYEGIQNDSTGNVWLVEDIGGASVAGGKKPNSYVYRFVPADKADLTAGGTLQALQVQRRDGSPITAAQLAADPASGDIADLHDPRRSFATSWVDVHTGTAAFDATAAAAAAAATPFKRPENGVFRPGTHFGEFYFTETGDTSTASTLPGAYGGVFRISQSSPSADTGRLAIVAVGDKDHTGLDNLAFAGADDLLVVEDAGDGLHQQRNALDSGYRVDLRGVRAGEDRRGARFTRWLAEGRDASALYDATTSPGYNDGDNEITGIHVSDGDPTVAGLLGARTPRPFDGTWRVFWTQQHGDNVTWEVSSTARHGDRH